MGNRTKNENDSLMNGYHSWKELQTRIQATQYGRTTPTPQNKTTRHRQNQPLTPTHAPPPHLTSLRCPSGFAEALIRLAGSHPANARNSRKVLDSVPPARQCFHVRECSARRRPRPNPTRAKTGGCAIRALGLKSRKCLNFCRISDLLAFEPASWPNRVQTLTN